MAKKVCLYVGVQDKTWVIDTSIIGEELGGPVFNRERQQHVELLAKSGQENVHIAIGSIATASGLLPCSGYSSKVRAKISMMPPMSKLTISRPQPATLNA